MSEKQTTYTRYLTISYAHSVTISYARKDLNHIICTQAQLAHGGLLHILCACSCICIGARLRSCGEQARPPLRPEGRPQVQGEVYVCVCALGRGLGEWENEREGGKKGSKERGRGGERECARVGESEVGGSRGERRKGWCIWDASPLRARLCEHACPHADSAHAGHAPCLQSVGPYPAGR